MIWALLQSESPWQRNDALRFLFIFVFLCTMNFFKKSLKVARSYLYACWLCFWFAFFRTKDLTDFYDFLHP